MIRIGALAIAGLAGCATVPETAWTALEVEGVEQEVICSGACDEEWRRAKEWIKKYSGYAFPAEVVVKPDRIEAFRVPFRDCVSVPQARRQFLARCTRPPLASEPLGFGDTDDPFSRIGKAFADGGPHWTFLVLRERKKAAGRESGWASTAGRRGAAGAGCRESADIGRTVSGASCGLVNIFRNNEVRRSVGR